jgi:hypothetical protein
MLSDGAISESPISFSDLGLTGNLSTVLSAQAALTSAISMAGNLPVVFSLAGQARYQRPIAGVLAITIVGQAALTTQIRLGAGVFVNLDASLFSGFTESTGIEIDPIPRLGSEYPELWSREPQQYVGIIDANDQLIEAEFSGKTYYLGVSWNEEAHIWTMSLRNLDRQLLVGSIAMVPLYPLLRQMRRDDFPPGELIIAISGEYRQMLHRDSFKNGEAVLFYVEPEDLADGAL